MPAVQLSGVVKHFGALHAVDGVDLDIPRGELFGLIGHNGAGKSTLFKMMLGLLPPTAGEIRVQGQPVSGRGFRSVRRGIGYLPENVVLYDNLSGLETLQFFGRLKGLPARGLDATCNEVLDRVGLAYAGQRAVRGYSKGMRQRLGFAQALLGAPQVLFLDEPTNGLDPEAIRGFYATLRALRDEGVTVVITSHILAELQERVDRLAILAAGRVQAVGSVQALRERVALPLRLQLRLATGDAAARAASRSVVQAVLDSLPLTDGQWRADAEGDSFAARCPRAMKLPALAALAALGPRLADLQLIEPSLEDLFFGMSD
ncbi:ABC transporter ATP-binding protein [Ideonella sp. DXS22W]|uniref:ABC transporter ATP-binding protein n=1 Tax=Pseudaquabacterium inlustre TaxID=2984192 RepID=A0ABU9CJE8_9BURK